MSMLRNGVMLTVMCILLCLTFNYTFPLRRESSKWNIFVNNNESLHCSRKRHDNTLERLKKLPPRIENTLKMLEEDNQKNKQHGTCHDTRTEDDLSNFEEMVIKKKNPYVDLKELELKFYNAKSTRQSDDPGPHLVEDPGICESENSINVEIINRGLSGFAVPAKLLKNVNEGVIAKVNVGNFKNDLENAMDPAISKKTPKKSDTELLTALKDDIKRFEESKAVNS